MMNKTHILFTENRTKGYIIMFKKKSSTVDKQLNAYRKLIIEQQTLNNELKEMRNRYYDLLQEMALLEKNFKKELKNIKNETKITEGKINKP